VQLLSHCIHDELWPRESFEFPFKFVGQFPFIMMFIRRVPGVISHNVDANLSFADVPSMSADKSMCLKAPQDKLQIVPKQK